MSHLRASRTFVAAALLAATALCAGIAVAGGNTQYRDPADPSQAIDETWDDRMLPITWLLSENGLPGSGIDNATLTAELSAAFDSWESPGTSKLDWTFGGEVPVHHTGLDGPLGPGIDGRNLVTFTDPDLVFPPGTVAVAFTFSFATTTVIDSTNSDLDGDGTPDVPEGSYAAGTIFDGDIAFNSSLPWSVSGANGTLDVRAVALHEIGHSFGLSHSMVREAVMWPFLNPDIAAARTPKSDDVAYASFYYPEEPAYSTAFGSIRGTITNGFSEAPVLGAHVYAVDPATGSTVVGAYSADDGGYTIPGLGAGSYRVAIEPLDGDPLGLDPFRVNEIVQFTFETNFPDEFHDENESNVETDPLAAADVAVAAGSDTTGIDLVTNTLSLPGVNLILEPGYNLIAYPVEVPSGLGAFDLLQALGDGTEVHSLARYDRATGAFQRAQYVDGAPGGADFPIARGEGYIAHMSLQKVVEFDGNTDCPSLDLSRGLNLIGVPCPPAGYRSYDLLVDAGQEFEVESIERFDVATGTFEKAEYDGSGQPTGADVPVVNGEGYAVRMLGDRAAVPFPPPSRAFAPAISGITPGRGVPGQIVVILGEGFDPAVNRNVVTFNGTGAAPIVATATSLTVTVPAGATSGPVRVVVDGESSNAIDFVVETPIVAEDPADETGLITGQTGQGTLSLSGEQDRYHFTALAGTLATIRADSVVAGSPDMVLLLEDPLGIVVATDDNGGGGTNARINNFALPSTGKYTIVVTNVPGSGTGSYTVSLNLAPQASEPQVSMLTGNYQTGLAGTTLPTPLTVLVTGPTGMPVAGVPVTFVANEVNFETMRISPIGAATTVIGTDSSGFVGIHTTLPMDPGTYAITVVSPGSPPATFMVAVAAKEVAVIQQIGGGEGTVGKTLPDPLKVILQDGMGDPVEGALVAFRVAAGGGSLVPASALLTDAMGEASTSWRLGNKIDDAQIVAAFVPATSQPLIFEAVPKADVPVKIESNKTHFTRMTMGTSVLNAMWVTVRDQHGNPVEGAEINYAVQPNSGLTVSPGLGPNGIFFGSFFTNGDGLHVAMVTADPTSPTRDEFGAYLIAPWWVVGSLEGVAGSELYLIDVDMGPRQVTFSAQNASAPIGQPLPDPVTKRVLRWQRKDTFEDVLPVGNPDGLDDDNGDFRDEEFMPPYEQHGVPGVAIDFEVQREDGNDETAVGLAPTTISSMQQITDANGLASVDVTQMSDVGGVTPVIGKANQIPVEWLYNDGSVITQQVFTDGRKFAEATNLRATEVIVSLQLLDQGAGVDLSTLVAKLNGIEYFNGTTPPAVLPTWPEKLAVYIGGAPQKGLDASTLDNSAFEEVWIHYYPSAPKLVNGQNTVEVVIEDKVENDPGLKVLNFNYP